MLTWAIKNDYNYNMRAWAHMNVYVKGRAWKNVWEKLPPWWWIEDELACAAIRLNEESNTAGDFLRLHQITQPSLIPTTSKILSLLQRPSSSPLPWQILSFLQSGHNIVLQASES